MSLPRLSVVAFCDPSHTNHGAQFIDHLLQQTLGLEHFELTVVGNRDSRRFRDDTTARAAQVPELAFRFVDCERPGRAAAINTGIALARAPLVVILADDAMPAPGALAAHLRYHEGNPDPLAVSIGPMLFREPLREDAFRRWLEDSGSLFGVSLRQQFTRWPQQFFYCGNCAIKKALVRQIGGFDERFPWITWDDYEFGLRLVAAGGYSQLLNGAVAWHEHHVTLDERLGSLRHGGHAAHLHEVLGATARPWQGMLDSARAARGQVLAGDDPALPLAERAARFQALLNRAFLDGYEAEARGDRSDLVNLRAST